MRRSEESGAGDPGVPGSPAPGQPGSTGQAAPTQQCLEQLPFLLMIAAVFYFLLIRPQQKQEKARREMLGALKVGDRVVTSGGMHGQVSTLTDEVVTLRVDPKLKLTFDRANIARVASDGDQPAQKEAG
ncbi:MAG: preprotein translocase subunit YajC [Planctomycetota bacterium]